MSFNNLPDTTGASGKYLKFNGTTYEWATVTGGTGSPGGSDTQVQFNDAGSFGGDAGMTYNKTTDALTITGLVHTPIVQAHTSAGLIIEAQGGTDCALFGAGGGANVTFYDGVKLDASTADRILSTDASKNITALNTTTYPTLTELSYVKGVTSAIQTQLNSKQATLTNPVTGTGTNNEIAAFNSTGSTITSLTTATYPSLTELSYAKGVTSAIQTQINSKQATITGAATTVVSSDLTASRLMVSDNSGKISVNTVTATEAGYLSGVTSAIQTQLDSKQATLTNGFGLTGTTTKAVSLTTAEAFCTAETTISAATYADITGASISLAAGTWIIFATVNGSSQTTTVTVMMAAITDGANAVVAESSQHIVAGTATVRTWGSLSLSAIVSPSGTTTYKLRGARGTTTQTGNWIASDGNGVNTVNNVSNNSDKGTGIRAIRIA